MKIDLKQKLVFKLNYIIKLIKNELSRPTN